MATPDPELCWSAILSTIKTAQTCCEQWMTRGKLSKAQATELHNELQAQFESYSVGASTNTALPRISGFLPVQPTETPGIRGYRAGMFVAQILKNLRSNGRISLAQFHALKADADERLMAVRRILANEGVSEADLADQCSITARTTARSSSTDALSDLAAQRRNDPPGQPDVAAEAAVPKKPRRNILEIILDPRSIQCLLGLGGALMVVGLVIVLYRNDYFPPRVLATLMALVNTVLLAAGLATIRLTRYQMVGKALSLLSCLVMPLNLWYCHSFNLITIDGNLWVAAVLISALYAVSAIVLKDELFVYVFSAGVAMTGLLILADLPPSPQRFWEIASPATLLAVLGLIGIHLERAFHVGDGAFSRDRFGMAFFWSGHVQLAAGLILILGAQVAGKWMYKICFESIYVSMNAKPSPVCDGLEWLALLLVVAGTYAYVYSDLVVRKKGIFVHVAAFTLLWAEVLIVEFLDLELTIDAIIAVLAVTSLLTHITQLFVTERNQYTRSFPVFGLLLGLLPVLMGVLVYLDHFGLQSVWMKKTPEWSFVGAMVLTAVASRVGAFTCRKSSAALMTWYFFATGAAVMVAAVAALAVLGWNDWQSHGPIMMLIPVAYLIAARLYGGRSPAKPLLLVAHASAAVMLISSLTSAFRGFSDAQGIPPLNLSLALFFAEASVFYGIATYFRRQTWCVYLSSFMAIASFWQLLTYFDVGTHTYILVFGVVGLLMLIAYRLALLEQTTAAPLAEALFQSSNAVLSLAFVSSVFYSLSQIAKHFPAEATEVDWGFAGRCFAMLVISVLAIVVTQHPFGRRWYVVSSVAQALVLLLAVHKLIDLNPWQQVELFAVLIGLILLVAGHIGWYREQDQQSDFVSMSLLFGALLTSVPLAIATWIDRGQDKWLPFNEFGFLFISVALLATGILFQLKTTTMVGSAATILYFVTLLLFIQWARLDAVAWASLIGGGVIFGSTLILAFFRDRLLTLPDRIKRREGAFRVFNWR